MYNFEFWGFEVYVSYLENISYVVCDVDMWDLRNKFFSCMGVYGVMLCALCG